MKTIASLRVAVFAILVFVALGAAGCVTTNKSGPALDKRGLFDALDENHDGRLSPKEYYRLYKSKNDSEGLFNQYDSNGDGSLDYDEFNLPHNTIIRW